MGAKASRSHDDDEPQPLRSFDHDQDYTMLEEMSQQDQAEYMSTLTSDFEDNREQWCVLVRLYKGCFNTHYLKSKTAESLRFQLGGNSASIKIHTLEGLLASPAKAMFKELDESDLNAKLTISDSDFCVGMETEDGFLESMVQEIRNENIPAVTRTWQQVPLTWIGDSPKPDLSFPSKIQANYTNIPLLTQKYANLSNCGWLDIEITLFHIKENHLIYKYDTLPWAEVPKDSVQTVASLI